MTRTLAVVTIVAALTGSIAGCGSSGSGASGSNSPPPPSSNAAATQPSSTATHAVINYAAYVGGKTGPANPKLSPIYIGFLNQQGGVQQPAGTAPTLGAQLAVRYINGRLGGIDGHPVALSTCFVASTEQQGATCATQFANNSRIPIIVTGGIATGIQSFYSTLGGQKPVVVPVSLTNIDAVQRNAVILFGDVTKILGPVGTYGRDVLHAHTAAVIYPEAPAITPGATALAAGLTAAGIKVTKVGYPPTETSLVAPLTAAGVQSADMVVPYSDPSGCVDQAKALQQLGVTDAAKIVSSPVCLTPAVAAGLGGDFPKWTYGTAAALAADPTDPSVPPFLAIMKRLGAASAASNPWVITTFSSLLTTAKWMNEVGATRLTSSSLMQMAKSYRGTLLLGAPAIQCGRFSDESAVCNDETQFYEYAGGGKFEKRAGWLAPPGA
jgi:branched-chain amino acid transport system substrate-binding protein